MATTISSSGTAAVTTQGVGSGLDIAGIVDKLMSIEQAPVTRLQNQESAYQTKVSAYGSVKSALATFQTTVSALTVPTAFSTFTASIGDGTVASVGVDASNTGGLSVGSHTLAVGTLAAAQRTASNPFIDTSSTVGTGTITIDVGSWNSAYSTFAPNATVGSKTITIDSSNNSLAGVRDAINSAGAGVVASIVNDGTGNRLVLAGATTGAANGFRIRTSDADGNDLDASGLSKIAFDPMATGGTPQTQHFADAVNATFTIDGLPISKPTNHVTDAIAGLTLDLSKVSTAPTSFSIARDTSGATKAVNNFVSAYNTIVTGIASLTSYDATTKTAGTLNGDSSMRLISSRLQALVTSVVPTGGSLTNVNDIGIKFGSDGQLTLDSAKLASAMASDPDAVGRIFAQTGKATDALVGYKSATTATTSGAHPLVVDQLATRGALAGSAAALQTITAGVNDSLAVTLDNVTSVITIPAGTYTDAASLATAVQATINGTTAFSAGGSSVVVSATGGVISATSQRYGSASNITVGGNGAATVFGASPVATVGVDVAGTLDGVAFTGSGQTVSGAAGSPAEGLKLAVTGGITGPRGTLTLTRGIAAGINDILAQFLDPTTGLLATQTDSLNKSITDLKAQEDAWTPRLDAIRARYTAQYNAMDALVASLNSTGSYLTQQITAIQNMTNSINSGK